MTVADSSVDKINVGVETNPRERLSGDVDDDKATSPTKTASTIDQQNTFCRKFALSRRQHRQRRRLSNVVRSSICVVVSTILAVVASAQSNEDSSLLPKNGKKLQYSLHTYAMFEFQSLAEIVTLIWHVQFGFGGVNFCSWDSICGPSVFFHYAFATQPHASHFRIFRVIKLEFSKGLICHENRPIIVLTDDAHLRAETLLYRELWNQPVDGS